MVEFLSEAEYLQNNSTNKTIDKAFEEWLANIRDLNLQEIRIKLKTRRAGINRYAKAFKRNLDNRELVPVVLKGSEDLKLDDKLSKCFDCIA